MVNLCIKSKKERIGKYFTNLFNNDNSYEKYNKQVKTAGKNTLFNKKGIHEAEDYLLNDGDFKSYGIEKYGKIAPHVFLETPEDLRVFPTYDSLMPDRERSSPALLTYRKLNEQIDEMIFNDVHRSATKYTNYVMRSATFILLGFVAFAAVRTMSLPEFTLTREYGEYLTGGAYVKEIVVGFGAYFLQMLASMGLGPIAVLTATTFAFKTLMKPVRDIVYNYTFYSRLNQTWKNLKHKLTYNMSLPTRQGRMGRKENEVEYIDEITKFTNSVMFATTVLKDDTLIELGTYTGLMWSKGVNNAPMPGTKAVINTSSLRTHYLVMGTTGSGKTECGLIPTALQFVENCERTDHKLGIFIMCGKGVLAHQFASRLPRHLRERMFLCGSSAGGYGLDLLKGLTPNEIAEQFQSIAAQIAKSPDSMKWINGAAAQLSNSATIMQFVDTNPGKLDLSDFWKDRDYDPYSLMGMSALATETKMRDNVSNRILENSDKFPSDVVTAARNFIVFGQMAPETITSYLSNITDVFSRISGVLAERFAYGKNAKGVKFVDLSMLDEGYSIGMTLSSSDDTSAGIIINNYVKSCLYSASQKRDTASNRAREKLARVDDEISGKSYELITKKGDLTTIRAKMSDDTDEAFQAVMDYLHAHYPKNSSLMAPWSAYSKLEIMKFIVERIDSVDRDMARYTDDVKLIAQETLTLRREALAKDQFANVSDIKSKSYREQEDIRDATSRSSVLIILDEAHFFFQGGNSATSDPFFLSIARSTGRIVLAATQSVESILSRLPEHETLALLTNFGTKLIMKSSDAKTQQLVVDAFGMSNAEPVLAKNGYANIARLMNSNPDLPITSIPFSDDSVSYSTNLNDAFAYGNSLYVATQNYDGGHRDQVDARQHENNEAAAVNERHNRLVGQQAFYEDQDKSGTLQSNVKPTDVANLVFRQGFLLVNRAGMLRCDKVILNDTLKAA